MGRVRLALITTHEAAERLGVNQSRIRQLIIAKQLPAKKFGRDWMIEEDDVENFDEHRRGAGRPATVSKKHPK